jgi:dTDP-4-amino-4,6-dideoxy-D-galactose acyltransferase
LKELRREEYDAHESQIDTEYLGINSAKVVLRKGITSSQVQNELISFINDFEFTTIINKGNNAINNLWLCQKTNAFLTDVNVQLVKNVSFDREVDEKLTSISNNFPETKKIIWIAENSFHYSRFLNDPYLPLEKARKTYGDITRNSFGKGDRYFNVYQKDDEIVGYILFSLVTLESTARINLIAIDTNFLGQRVGHILINTLDNYLYLNDIHTLRVGTQIDNVGALNFYASIGFKYIESNSIYHYWHNNRIKEETEK